MTERDSGTLVGRDAELHYETWGRGEPLLLLHGFFGAGTDFAHLLDLEALARRYRLIVPDLRGHGRSRGMGHGFSHRACADDMRSLLAQLGVERTRALGTSLGGNTLLHLATQAPALIEAMVVVSSPSYFPAQARPLMASVSLATHGDEERRMLREKHAGEAQLEALFETARGFAVSHDDMNFTPPLLATIRARTLLVCGDRDPFYPVSLFVEMFQAIPAASLWVVPGAGHTPVYGEQRAQFERTALAFLDGQA